MNRIFIGLDDTDFGDSIGTGALSRELMVHLVRELDVRPCGITRHQFFIHPDIPYTSHNSSACLEIECTCDLAVVADICRTFIKFLFHPGADPGLCVATKDQLTDELVDFGQRAQRVVLKKEEAIDLAKKAGILLEEHGGEGIGIIGAVGGCALRMDGNDGRFIAHTGIREVDDILTVAKLKETSAVELVKDEAGSILSDSCIVETKNWIRPDLEKGLVVVNVIATDTPERFFVKKKKKGIDDM